MEGGLINSTLRYINHPFIISGCQKIIKIMKNLTYFGGALLTFSRLYEKYCMLYYIPTKFYKNWHVESTLILCNFQQIVQICTL